MSKNLRNHLVGRRFYNETKPWETFHCAQLCVSPDPHEKGKNLKCRCISQSHWWDCACKIKARHYSAQKQTHIESLVSVQFSSVLEWTEHQFCFVIGVNKTKCVTVWCTQWNFFQVELNITCFRLKQILAKNSTVIRIWKKVCESSRFLCYLNPSNWNHGL